MGGVRMDRSFVSRLVLGCAVMGLPWLSACCANGQCEEREKVYVDKYETVKCTNCPKPKYVYHKAPCLPEKVVRVHRIVEPCPPQKVIDVQLPPDKQKVRYEYVTEGTCKKPCDKPLPCDKPCKK